MSVEASSDFSAAVPSSSLGLLRQIDAGLLNVGCVDIGPAEGPVVVLLHGWPYDIHSYVDVCAGLTAAGYRVIVPYVRDLCPVCGRRLRNVGQAVVVVTTSWGRFVVAALLRELKLVPSVESGTRLKL